MQFTTLTLSALSVAGAIAQSTTSSAADTTTTNAAGIIVHVVKVGGINTAGNGSLLAFTPNSITANPGEIVQFQFAPATGPTNHTVTQSAFDTPCAPVTDALFSGFQPVKPADSQVPTWSIMVKDTTPIWLYCSQAKHCQAGMTAVINVKAGTNKTLDAYTALAKQATANLAPGAESGGTNSNTSATSTGSGSSGTGTTSGSSSTTSGSTKATSSSAAQAIRISGETLGMGGLLAVGMALLI